MVAQCRVAKGGGMATSKQVGKKIARLRKIHRYNQSQLADKLGVTRQAVHAWENGVSFPAREAALRLSKLLGGNPAYYLGVE